MTRTEPPTDLTVRSNDGTVIAYESTGEGPPLILIDAAAHYRTFSSFDGLVGLLAGDFTVIRYDRRGRGQSGDAASFVVQREVDDLAALIAAVGGSAYVYAFSSGGLLAVHAAVHGLSIPKMALLEPPIAPDDDRAEQRAFTRGLSDLVSAGDHEGAVNYYLTGIGVPDEILEGMRGTHAWSAMVDVAPSLVYDSMISEATTFDLLTSVQVRTLILDSEGSGDDLSGMAATVANGIPGAEHRSLAGEWHGVADEVLAPVLTEFFTR